MGTPLQAMPDLGRSTPRVGSATPGANRLLPSDAASEAVNAMACEEEECAPGQDRQLRTTGERCYAGWTPRRFPGAWPRTRDRRTPSSRHRLRCPGDESQNLHKQEGCAHRRRGRLQGAAFFVKVVRTVLLSTPSSSIEVWRRGAALLLRWRSSSGAKALTEPSAARVDGPVNGYQAGLCEAVWGWPLPCPVG